MILSCQTFSNPLDISENTLLTFISLSKDSQILWVMNKSCLTHESPGLNPDLYDEIKFFDEKVNISFAHRVWELRKLGDSF